MVIQIVIHGRGGQGAVKAVQLLALAASLEGKYSQAFPSFGIEREGAPVEAYCRISDKPIILRSHVDKADYAIILDSSLLKVKRIQAKTLIINSTNKKINKKACEFDATSLALKIFGKPFVNTAMLAVFSCFTGIISRRALIEACKESFSEGLFKKNLQAIEEVYKNLK
ncbi:MAG: 2-oxoacid:acceptor oxidoreductase family protein [Candidatus Pacearchaeota archaeon]